MTCTLTTECPDAANLRIMLDGTCSHCDDYLMLSADQKTCSEVSCKAQTNTILTKEALCEHVVDYKVQCPDDQLRECDPVVKTIKCGNQMAIARHAPIKSHQRTENIALTQLVRQNSHLMRMEHVVKLVQMAKFLHHPSMAANLIGQAEASLEG